MARRVLLLLGAYLVGKALVAALSAPALTLPAVLLVAGVPAAIAAPEPKPAWQHHHGARRLLFLP